MRYCYCVGLAARAPLSTWLLLLLSTCLTGCWLLPQSPYRQALPESAAEILEHRSGTVDFTYLLRARITEDEFRTYVDELGLAPVNNAAWKDDGVVKPSQPHPDDPEWWSPIRPVDGVFQLRQDSDIISAKYEDGFIYLSVIHL